MTVNVEISARNLEVTDHIRDYVSKKASKLDRYLAEIEQVKVELEYFKTARNATDRFVAQITARGHKALLRTEDRSEDLITAFDVTIDKMQRQLERYKGKHYRGRGDGHVKAPAAPAVVAEEPADQGDVISRHKTFDLIPMNEGEALEQMKLLGHDNFFIFFNVQTDSINVLYLRRDGTYGLIEPKIH